MSSWLTELTRKSSYFNNYLKKRFFQAYCFNFQSNQDSFFINNIARILGWHIKLEKGEAFQVFFFQKTFEKLKK